MINNPFQIAEQLKSVDDGSLQRALTMPLGIPQYVLMSEIERRQRFRATPQVAAPHRTMLQEMQQGIYRPVPIPPQHIVPPRPETVNQAQPQFTQGYTAQKPSAYPNVGLQGQQQQAQPPKGPF